MKLCRTVKWGW